MIESEKFKDALKSMLLREFPRDFPNGISEITSFYESVEYAGGCETCSFELVECAICYVDCEGDNRCFTYSDGFSNLLTMLLMED